MARGPATFGTILSAAAAITNAPVLFVVCRAYSGCWDWLEPVPTGPSRSVCRIRQNQKRARKPRFANVVLGGGQECSAQYSIYPRAVCRDIKSHAFFCKIVVDRERRDPTPYHTAHRTVLCRTPCTPFIRPIFFLFYYAISRKIKILYPAQVRSAL